MFANEQEALAHVDQQVADAEAHKHKAQDVLGQMDAVRATGQSSDGGIEVVLGRTGGLVDVRIGDAAFNGSADALRRALLEANTNAQQALVRQITVIAESAYGEHSATAAAVSEQYRSDFPPPNTVRPDNGIGG